MKPRQSRAVYLCAGKDGNTTSAKMVAMIEAAVSRGFQVEIPNVAETPSPEKRVQWLLDSDASEVDCLVLIGVSMGGYVATVAAEKIPSRGLFLVGPALYVPQYAHQNPQPESDLIEIVHGLDDAVVPVENIRRFAREFGARTHFLEGGHSLEGNVPFITEVFSRFLDRVLKG
jgi:alpha/beta superfamily hydrolase